MMYLRMDEETGAKFAGDEITREEAVVSLMTLPRSGPQDRVEKTLGFLREWLTQLPERISRITTWASNDSESEILRGVGFVDESSHVSPGGGRSMVMKRAA